MAEARLPTPEEADADLAREGQLLAAQTAVNRLTAERDAQTRQVAELHKSRDTLRAKLRDCETALRLREALAQDANGQIDRMTAENGRLRAALQNVPVDADDGEATLYFSGHAVNGAIDALAEGGGDHGEQTRRVSR